LEFVGAFESTFMPAHDVDVLETSGHARCWKEDLEAMRDLGITRVRYPVRWHRVEPRPGALHWEQTDEVLEWMAEHGMVPIVDLVHHTSYPRWMEGGFGDARFGPAYLRYCEAFARRYDWIEEYTLFNEPFATLFLAGHVAVWPPYRRGRAGLISLYREVMPALTAASRLFADLLPRARHVWVDTCEGHTALDGAAECHAELCNDRRFFALDVFLGRLDRPERRRFVEAIVAAGGEDLLAIEPGTIDVLGLDYYAHSEWAYLDGDAPVPATAAGHELHPNVLERPGALGQLTGIVPSPDPVGLAALIMQYAERYEHPLLLTETNIRGTPGDRATWLKHTLGQCGLARDRGAALGGYCWFPFIDSLDWNSLLSRADRCIDPVGVLWLDESLQRRSSTMLTSYARAAAGTPSAQLPAYRFTEATARWVSGLLPAMADFAWQPAPEEEREFDLDSVAVRAEEAA
jgi:beta-glucosidase/6-phospho-beta-glucosidase/beta-galactosidase